MSAVAAARSGIPIGWATNGANRHDVVLFEPTLTAADERGLLTDIETLHLDRGYDKMEVALQQLGADIERIKVDSV